MNPIALCFRAITGGCSGMIPGGQLYRRVFTPGGSMHQPAGMMDIIRRACMKHTAVVPQDGVTDAPAMPVLIGRLTGVSGQFRDKRPCILFALADDADGDLIAEIECPTSAERVLAYQWSDDRFEFPSDHRTR